jgi:surfeit locus 1 family protein
VRRFPVGLTVAAAVGLAVLIGLGVWQVYRLGETRVVLARIAKLQHAKAVPAGAMMRAMAKGANVEFTRVNLTCAPAVAPVPAVFRYALRNERVGWRLMGWCAAPDGAFSGIVLDRGLVNAFSGEVSPHAMAFAAPQQVTGVLRAPGRHSFLSSPPRRQSDGSTVLMAIDPAAISYIAHKSGGARPAPDYLAVEQESPAPAGLTPAALPEEIPNNHFVYALTWFGLAAILVWMWAGYVLRRGS